MEIKDMIVELKLKGFTAQAIENELGFSNGSLGKKLSSGREYMLRNFYEVHCGSNNVGDDDVVTFLVLRSGVQVRPTDENVMRLFGGMISKVVWKNEMDGITRKGVVWDGYAVDTLKFDEVGQFDKVLSKKSLPSASSDDVPGDFVFPDGLDDVLVDYQKLYDECMFPDEYKALWERISSDPNVSAKELPIWKIRLNVK